ncbi:MAG: ABC transporter permease [Gemmatimonadota bacterium]|nr:ABC transporter permease [Gemmatimonadota bacterium]
MTQAWGRLWWRIAWRNLWRNKRRTLLTASALSFGFVASVLMIGLSDGVVEQMIQNGTELVTGQIQIHDQEFLPERGIHDTLGGSDGIDLAGLLAALDEVPLVSGAAPRVYGGGLVSSGDETVGAILMGIDPLREPNVSAFAENLVSGAMPGPGQILVGDQLADDVEVDVGDEVVLVAPAADGSLGNDLFVVSGIFSLDTGLMDGAYALLGLEDLQFLMALPQSRIHEVAMKVDRTRDSNAVAEEVGNAVQSMAPGLLVQPWSEFLPQLYFFTSLASASNLVIAGMIFGMAVFGVANTMLIATYERRREFAVVRALGTARRSVGLTVVCEGILLGAVSLAAGVMIALPLMAWIHAHPIDLSRWVGSYSMMGSSVRPLVTVEYSWDGPIFSGLALVVTGLASALYPAWKAVRVPPADALSSR